jgi:uncharacterized protein (DUF433 family)
MTTATAHCHIVTDEGILGGEPIIRGTRTPVRAIVEQGSADFAPFEVCGFSSTYEKPQSF